MEDEKAYLNVLSKVMQENYREESELGEKINEIYSLVHTELEHTLQKCQYSNAPRLIRKLDNMIEDMNCFCICEEMIGKECLLIVNNKINLLFLQTDFAFADKKLSQFFAEIDSTIPFLVLDGEETIEAVNFSDHRSNLTCQEYSLLMRMSAEKKIALDKIVRFFIVKIPMKGKNISFWFDSQTLGKKQIFDRAISKRIVISSQNVKKPDQKDLFRKNIHDTGSRDTEISQQYPSNFLVMSKSSLKNELKNETVPVLYGFSDELRAIELWSMNPIWQSCNEIKKTLRTVAKDAVYANGKSNMLSEIERHAQDSLEQLSQTQQALVQSFLELRDKLKAVTELLKDRPCANKAVPRRVLDDIFDGLFAGAKKKRAVEKEILSRLTTIGYHDWDLVAEYIQSKEGTHPGSDTIQPEEWEKAKIYLYLNPLESVDESQLTQWVSALRSRKRMNTGKEFYAAFLLDPNHKEYLTKSAELGYAPACARMMKLSDDNLEQLAEKLNMEACFKLGEAQCKDYPLGRRAVYTDSELNYYKIAASQGSMRAVYKIAEYLYISWFSDCTQLTDAHSLFGVTQAMKENGQVIIQLCQVMREKRYRSTEVRTMLGVTYCCLNENFSDAMPLLGGITKPEAEYCKGYMYEYGRGTVRDWDQAIEHYSKVTGPSLKEMAEKRKKACLVQQQQKRSLDESRKSSGEAYDNKEHYRAETSNYSSSTSFCFITTAVCKSLGCSEQCDELNMLRKFRDEHIQNTPRGETIVAEYYRVAPDIVKKIEQMDHPEELYRKLWNEYILPSCDAIRKEKWKEAQEIYVSMVKRLCRQYHVQINKQTFDALGEQYVEL